MATKRPTKPRRTLLQEATNLTTDPARLRQLADHKNFEVRQAVWRNPSVPEDVWRTAFLEGGPETWDNPMASIYILTWMPRQDDQFPLEWGVRWATQTLWSEPARCSPEGKTLLAAKVQEWWATSESADDMMIFLGWWVEAKGNDSPEYLEVVRILVLCARTAPNLTDGDHRAIDLLEAWTTGGKDRRDEAKTVAFSKAVIDTVKFSQDSRYSPWNSIYEVLWAVNATAGEQAKAEHNRQMAELIRREMPLPPVVE